MSDSAQFDLFVPAEPIAAKDDGSTMSANPCPRCGRSVDESAERFYGPCTDCRTELRTKFLLEGRSVDVAEYEPKMNVTPNAVALKDD